MKTRDGNPEECVHCGLCRKNCVFLSKYNLEIGDTEKLRELSYHCFLCGKCSEVCPLGIDGRQAILEMREAQTERAGGRPGEKGYGMLLWEKKDYRFRSYRNKQGKSALFPGCNFPSFYPETTKYLAGMLREKAGIGTVFDCCGKPVAELGMRKKSEQQLRKLEERLEKAGIEELILLCPNCYYFLKGRLRVRVTDIYTKLWEMGEGQCVVGDGTVRLFPPCPDREEKEILQGIRLFLNESLQLVQGVQCCGLGGCGGVKEPGLAGTMTDALDRKEKFCTYCASCAGNFARKGYVHGEHVLPLILGTNEKADTRRSLLNRIRFRWWKAKEKGKEKHEYLL